MLYIFDWDGTILDSTAKIVGCMQLAINDADIVMRDEQSLKEIIGLGLGEAILSLYPESDSNQINYLKERSSPHFIHADQTPGSYYPNVLDTLNALREQGHHLAVATGKSRKGLDRVLGNLDMGTFFHASRCADETQSKPHPQMLFELLEYFDIGSEQAVMVGDTEFDMAMAKAAGIERIAVSYGAHKVERLLPHDVYLIDDFSEVLDWRAGSSLRKACPDWYEDSPRQQPLSL
jgi:phosphoglycolate phosphatase